MMDGGKMKMLASVMAVGVLLVADASPVHSVENDGQALLKQRCGRCHAVSPETKSPLGTAPNLWDKLQSYPSDQLEFELAEGMGSRHAAMPQIQFSSEEIAAVQTYLAGE
jgi:mono/diheme cytochrome c family protein